MLQSGIICNRGGLVNYECAEYDAEGGTEYGQQGTDRCGYGRSGGRGIYPAAAGISGTHVYAAFYQV